MTTCGQPFAILALSTLVWSQGLWSTHASNPGARIVTFGNGMVVHENIVTIDNNDRRVVWSAVGGSFTHHNGSAQALANAKGGTTVVWIADFLPDEAAGPVAAMMEQGISTMKQTLDLLAR